jgi:hypothetical protein
VSELRDRLEALATRGTRRGADDVLNAARRDAETDGAEHASDTDDDEMSIIDDGLPLVTLELGSRRRRRFGSFVASAGIAALVGVGALGIMAMFGNGGAGSPEGAVRQLADAITHKDALAAVDVLVPTEVRSMRETVDHLTQRAADLRIVDEASRPLAGVDLSVDHLELTTESLADGYAKVVVTSGEISAGTHRAQMSALLQKALRQNESDTQDKVDLAKLAADSDLPTFVVVVRRNGGWYVSPVYTALEYARAADGGPAAAFGSAHAAELGADSPEVAVSDALRAWQAANWDRLMALAPPDELPVYDYRAWIAQAAADTHPDFVIDTLSTSATVNGDKAVVKLEASGTFGSDPVERWQLGGTCPAFGGGWFGYSGSYDDSSFSSPEQPELCVAGDGHTVPFGLIALGQSSGTSTSGPVSIEVVREDGRWFVSGVATVLDLLDATIDHVDERTAYTLLGIAYDLPPDGTITLDQPFQVAGSTSILSSRVYAFDGEAGKKVIGQFNSTGASGGSSFAYGTVYTAAGDEVDRIEFQSVRAGGEYQEYSTSVQLPSTGSYRLVLEPYSSANGAVTLTLWDFANAPQQLLDSARSNDGRSYETCTSTGGLLGGSGSCEAVSVAPTTTYTVPGSSQGSWSPSPVDDVTGTSTAAPTTTVP